VELSFQIASKSILVPETVPLQVGDEVITAVSYRYTISQFEELMEQYFDKSDIFLSQDGSTALAVGHCSNSG
jgi:hypothetical protein